MPRSLRWRRHVPHIELRDAAVLLNWRLHRRQPPLSRADRLIVLEVIRSGEPRFCTLLAVVVMPDHVHALVMPRQGVTARRLAVAWRGIAAHRLVTTSGREGPIWQQGYFDRWKRTPTDVAASIRYVADNPRRRWPGLDRYDGLWLRPNDAEAPRARPPAGP